MLSEALGLVMAILRVSWGDSDSPLYGWHSHPGVLSFPSVPSCFFPKATSHSSEIHFDLCLHDCLLSFRLSYLGELWWPFVDDILIKGSFSPQIYYYAPGTTLLFLALDWCLIWERDISFSNLQATHFWLWPILALFWMTAPWPLVEDSSLLLICRSVEDFVFVHGA